MMRRSKGATANDMSGEAAYQRQLTILRQGFPAPAESPADEQFVARIAESVRAALKLRGPGARLLGTRPEPPSARQEPLDARLAAISPGELAASSESLDAIAEQLVAQLQGLPLEVHPRGQVNVNVQPSTISLIATLLPAIFNPNMSSDGRGAGCSDAEREVTATIASLVGYDPATAGGVFTFGGTGTLLYGVKLGLERACSDVMRRGVREDCVVLASERSHHTCLTAAGWLGIGADFVRRIRVKSDNAMDIAALREVARTELNVGRKIAAIVATVGTTDAFGVDDVEAIVALRDALVDEFHLDYRPHVHADAVIGWAWSALNDYDVTTNPWEYSREVLDGLATVVPRIRGLRLADSLGVDFHKTGFAPYVSSLVLARDSRDFHRLAREPALMPYLFHSGSYHPGLFTLETTRAAGGVMAAWANLRWLGRVGLQVLLGHALEMTAELRRRLRTRSNIALVNEQNTGPVTLYRLYPQGVSGTEMLARERTDPAARDEVERHNEFQRRGHAASVARMPDASSAAIGLTSVAGRAACGEPLVALKSYLLSPWLEPADLDAIMRQLDWCQAHAEG